MANFMVLASRKDQSLLNILTLLQELDTLYSKDSLELYEQQWQETAKLIEQVFPGFTMAYAELYNSGIDRVADGALHHVLVPKPQGI